ncbi:MAG: relaxase/mobilization nuclease domain-containing protein [Candidatus Thiodiazotropha sp. (ex. Lucinisca nassula)]|nr:relaxase/mobilization nuclease domain-containing protein [Candidatus Thiodiazotropha sp. (ex. Lucinisca nassula)]
MIPKITEGSGGVGLHEYMQKPDSTVLYSSYENDTPAGRAREGAELHATRPDVKNPTLHLSIGFHRDERRLSDEDMRSIALGMLNKIGVDPENHRACIIRHHDKQEQQGRQDFHIAVERIGVDGKLWSNAWSARKSIKAARELEHENGLRVTSPGRERARTPDTQEQGLAERIGEKSPRQVLAERVDEAVEHTSRHGTGLPGMIEHLQQNGVETLLTHTRDGRLRGISFRLSGWEGSQSPQYKGSAIGKSYSLQGLTRRLSIEPEHAANTTQSYATFSLTAPTLSAPNPSSTKSSRHVNDEAKEDRSPSRNGVATQSEPQPDPDADYRAYMRALRAAARAQRQADRDEHQQDETRGQAARDGVARRRSWKPRL